MTLLPNETPEPYWLHFKSWGLILKCLGSKNPQKLRASLSRIIFLRETEKWKTILYQDLCHKCHMVLKSGCHKKEPFVTCDKRLWNLWHKSRVSLGLKNLTPNMKNILQHPPRSAMSETMRIMSTEGFRTGGLADTVWRKEVSVSIQECGYGSMVSGGTGHGSITQL